jgi:hypothetical protein
MEKTEKNSRIGKKDKYSRSPPTLCQWGSRRATTALCQRTIMSMIIWNSQLALNLQIFFFFLYAHVSVHAGQSIPSPCQLGCFEYNLPLRHDLLGLDSQMLGQIKRECRYDIRESGMSCLSRDAASKPGQSMRLGDRASRLADGRLT